MLYPTLPTVSATKETVEVFAGYNHNLRIGDGEFYDMKNLTSEFYPVFSPRKARGYYCQPAAPEGILAKDSLCYVDGEDFIIGDTTVAMGLSTAEEDNPKKLVSMGAYVIILPDKKYINTADLSDYGDIEAGYSSTGTVSFTMCTSDGTAIESMTVSTSAPENPVNLDYWLDTSATPNVLKRYTVTTKTWTVIATTYVKISATGIGAQFEEYDGVTLSGITAVEDLNGSAVIYGKGADYIVVIGLMKDAVTQTGTVTVKRSMPNLDYVTESGNRLWGCRYGTAANGEQVNEIYACKLGDFKNWNVFLGLSTDSYTASCGTDGAFTGAITHLGYPLFFKEACVHKVYGSIPSSFQIQTTTLRGVQEGCSESLAIVNEILYYKSRSGICAYDGNLPSVISDNFGTESYQSAVGGSHRDKYYISMQNTSTLEWGLFVYDGARGVWHKEDDIHVSGFASLKDELFLIDADSRNILTEFGSGIAAEDTVEWMAETGDLGLSSQNRKYVSRLNLRLKAGRATKIKVSIQYDLDGEWLPAANVYGMGLRSIDVSIRPRRCDHLKLKLEGTGECKIYSLVKTVSEGSDER